MRELRRLLIGVASAAAWPLYLALVAYAAKAGPGPRDVAWPACVALLALSAALMVLIGGRMAFRSGGWAEEALKAPKEVLRQVRRVVATIVIAGLVLLLSRNCSSRKAGSRRGAGRSRRRPWAGSWSSASR